MDQLFMHLATCCCTEQHQNIHGDCGLADEIASGLQQLHLSTQGSPSPFQSTRSRSHAAAAQPGPYRLFAFDLESTGFNHAYDAIIEMAVVDVASDAHWHSLIRPVPWKRSHPEALAAHGITDAMLGQPGLPTVSQAWREVLEFVTKHTPVEAKPILVAHNGFAFDFRMLCCCLIRAQQQQCTAGAAAAAASGTGSSSNKWWWLHEGLLTFDALHVARSLKLKDLAGLENLKQATVVRHFLGSPPEVCHRALADAQQLAKMLPCLLGWAAQQISHELDERLLPRKLAVFAAAAAAKLSQTAAAAAGSSVPDAVAVTQHQVGLVDAAAAAADDDDDDDDDDGAVVDNSAAVVPHGADRGKARSRGSRTAAATIAHANSMSFSSSSGTATRGVAVNATVTSRALGEPLEVKQAAAAAGSTGSSSGRGSSRGQGQQSACPVSSGGGSSSSKGGVTSAVQGSSAGDIQLATVQDAAAPAAATAKGIADATPGFVFAAPGAAAVSRRAGRGKGRSGSIRGHSSSKSSTTAAAAGRGGGEGGATILCVAAGSENPLDASGMSCKSVVTTAADAELSADRGADLQSPYHAVSSGRQTLGLPDNAYSGHQIQVRGKSVPVLTAPAFVQLMAARQLLHLGPSVPGKSGGCEFCDVLLGCVKLPVVFLLEGLAVAKDLSFKIKGDCGSVAGVTLLLKGGNRQQQQLVQQVATAVDEITTLLSSRRTDRPLPQQQQQQQRVFSCLSGGSLQVRLPCTNSSPHPVLETIIMQSDLNPGALTPPLDGNCTRTTQVSSSSNSGDRKGVCRTRVLPRVLAVPSLQSPEAASVLQKLLPVGGKLSVLLSPASVWLNSHFVGVTLNCLQVLRMEPAA